MEVKAHYREGKKSPWEARWWVNRRMRSRFFPTKRERDEFIRNFQREIGKHGEEVFKVDVTRQREWREVDDVLPNVSPLALAEFWLKHHRSEERRIFRDAVQAYLLEMKRAGRDAEYQKHTLRVLQAFAACHGDQAVEDITSQHVSDYLHGLPHAALTKRHH